MASTRDAAAVAAANPDPNKATPAVRVIADVLPLTRDGDGIDLSAAVSLFSRRGDDGQVTTGTVTMHGATTGGAMTGTVTMGGETTVGATTGTVTMGGATNGATTGGATTGTVTRGGATTGRAASVWATTV